MNLGRFADTDVIAEALAHATCAVEANEDRQRHANLRLLPRSALEVAAAQRFTVIGEVLGRWIDTPGHIVPESSPNQSLPGVETVRLVPDTSTLRTLTAVPGIKWNVSDTWVLAANVTVPLTSSGLTTAVTPFVGLDYAWSP